MSIPFLGGGVRHFFVLHQVCRMNSALHGAGLSPVNVIAMKIPCQATSLRVTVYPKPSMRRTARRMVAWRSLSSK